jgi:tRNA-5-methyluridine54 2-sulfurtransferase
MNIEQKVKNTIRKYKLLDKKDKILVALSGGKDSAVTAYILKKLGYNIEGIHLSLGLGEYSRKCLKSVEKLCDILKIKLHIYYIKEETGKNMVKIFREKDKKLSNCTLCGVIKKWYLNKKARELKVDKIATGHNFNDEIETFFMNILKGSPNLNSNFSPILKIKNKKFVVKIKPLFFILNDEIDNYSIKLNLPIHRKICPYRQETYRVEIRDFMKRISEKEKKNLMNNFLELSKRIKEDKKSIRYCKICGEPSRGEICKRCRLLKKF